MLTIYEIAKSRRYRIVLTNLNKRFLILKLKMGYSCRIYVPFDLVPAKAMLELTSGINPQLFK
jgi:hypothetical protein